VAGIVFFGVLVEWTRYFGAVALVPFVLFLSTWWMLAGAAAGWLGRRGVTAAPVLAALWVAVEAGRGRVPFGGFPWGDVGYALHSWRAARALAGWGGVPLVSWVVVAVNGFLLEAVLAWRRRSAALPPGLDAGSPLRPLAGAAVVAAASLAAAAALPSLTPTGRLRVAMVQANDRNRDLTTEEIRDRYLVRNHLRLAAGITAPADLITLSESSLDADPRTDPSLDAALSGLARDHQADVLAGGTIPASHGRLYNAVFHYDPASGRTPELYRKRHLVPFGEFVPWRSQLSFIRALQAVPIDFERGPGPTEFSVAGHRLGALICFESAFGPLARQYARGDVDALMVLTNNHSYRRSANSAQHLAMGQFRAAETGRPLFQAAISGISALVDHTGRVRAQTDLFEPVVLEGELTTYRGRTPYTVLGEWVVIASGLLLVASAVAASGRRPTRDGGPTRS
jgi:apolipoprotein N-acyltransferase